MQVPPAYSPEKYFQGVLANSKRPDEKSTVLHRQIYGSSFLHLRLRSEGPWNPQSKAVPPLLDLRLHTPPHGYTMSRRRGGSGSSTPLLRSRSPPASSRFAVEDLHAPIDLYSWARPLLCPRHLPAHVDHPKPEAERETAIHREDTRNEVEQTSLSGQRIVLGQLLEFEKVMVEPRSNNTKQQEAHRKYTDPAKDRQNYGPAPGGGSGCA